MAAIVSCTICGQSARSPYLEEAQAVIDAHDCDEWTCPKCERAFDLVGKPPGYAEAIATVHACDVPIARPPA